VADVTGPSKSEQTRALILDTALAMFRERGFEETTMRAIAEKAGVSLGNAYYYFKSKEHMIQEFYMHTHVEHLEAAGPVLEREKTLKARLLGSMRAKVDTLEQYHAFAGILFKSAADPKSPLNPFSPESIPTRKESTAHFDEVVRGAKTKLRIPADLMPELANLIWVYHMGIILFWIHDKSAGCKRTYLLVEHSVDIIVKLIGIASLPLVSPLRKRVLKLLAELNALAEPQVENESETKPEAEAAVSGPAV
jgi:AcrR family transcriptional regulator